jgi:hypothetical protein
VLERHACGCYRVVKDEYDRLLPVAAAHRPAALAVRDVPDVPVALPGRVSEPRWHQPADLN